MIKDGAMKKIQDCKEENGINATYHGETGRCAKVRCGEHARDLRSKLPGSNLYQHFMDQNSGDEYEVS